MTIIDRNCTLCLLINTAVLLIAFFVSLIACFCLNTYFMVKALTDILTVMAGPEILVILCLQSEFIDRNKQSRVCASQYVLSASTPCRLSSCDCYIPGVTTPRLAQVATRIILR